jgi:predicted hydrocarbon binding protein
MKKALNLFILSDLKEQGSGIVEYLENSSKTDEHYIRAYEYYECWGFQNVGATIASHIPPILAGLCKGLEREEREWNAIETKCIGLGDSYCEFKLLPGKIDELSGFLAKDSSLINMIFERLMRSIMEFMLNERPLVERHRLGSDFLFTDFPHPVTSERYRMALGMGGAKAGKEIGHRLVSAQIEEKEAVKRLLKFLRHCKVGKIVADKTLRIHESCESQWTKLLKTKFDAGSCFFTTGFLNGFFSAVKNLHVREIKCIGMGNPYCEWEFR